MKHHRPPSGNTPEDKPSLTKHKHLYVATLLHNILYEPDASKFCDKLEVYRFLLTAIFKSSVEESVCELKSNLAGSDYFKRNPRKRQYCSKSKSSPCKPIDFAWKEDLASCPKKRRLLSTCATTAASSVTLLSVKKPDPKRRLWFRKSPKFCFSANANENNDNFLPSSAEPLDNLSGRQHDNAEPLHFRSRSDFVTYSDLRERAPSNNTNPLSSHPAFSIPSKSGDNTLDKASINSPEDLDHLDASIIESQLRLTELDKLLAGGAQLQPKAIKDFGTFTTSRTATLSSLSPPSRLPRLVTKTQHRLKEQPPWSRQALKQTRSDPAAAARSGWLRFGSTRSSELPTCSHLPFKNLPKSCHQRSLEAPSERLFPFNRNTNATVAVRPFRDKFPSLDEPKRYRRKSENLADISSFGTTSGKTAANSLRIRLQHRLSTATEDKAYATDPKAPLPGDTAPHQVARDTRQVRVSHASVARLPDVAQEKIIYDDIIDLNSPAVVRQNTSECPSSNISKSTNQFTIHSSKSKTTHTGATNNGTWFQVPRKWTVFRKPRNRATIETYQKSTEQRQQSHQRDLEVSQVVRARSTSNNRQTCDSEEFARTNRRSLYGCCSCVLCLPFDGVPLPQRLARLRKVRQTADDPSPQDRSEAVVPHDINDMGCFQSVHKAKVGPCRTTIHSEVKASIDPTETVIEEYSPIVLRYRTPYFRATAVVTMPPITRKETWTVGWIQACDHMEFINQYGNLGCSSWEIPALKSGKIPAVSDSDGVSYPWYGSTTEIATIVGPTDSFKRMTLSMNDNFYPSVTWDIPVSEGTKAHLTSIVRDQSFVTWLAAINETTKEIIVLKTVRWKFYLKIDIDPLQTLGSRARVVAPQFQEQPTVSSGSYERRFIGDRVREKVKGADNNSNSNYVGQIPMSALVRPSANNAQTLIWRPTRHSSQVVVPAKESHKDKNELVLFNGCSAMQGKESIITEVSKQEMLRMQQVVR